MKTNLIKTGIALLIGIAIVFGISRIAEPCAGGCNVILIMVDTLAANHIGTYGYSRDTMPEVTAFFEKNGTIFDNATSNSTWTLPSFTGMYFSDIASNITYKELDDNSRPSLQSELYAHNVTVRAIRPMRDLFIFDAITRLYRKDEVHPADEKNSPVDLGKQQLAELSKSNNPFFLLVHTFEVHEPYKPEAPYNNYFESLEGYSEVTAQELVNINWYGAPVTPGLIDAYRLRYDQQLAQADHNLAGFLNSIPASTLAHTVVILAADHGEAFYEHGSVRHGENGIYQEEAHIPLMMRVPGVSPRRVEEPVSLMDMSPTVLSLMRIPIPREFKGESLIPLLLGSSLGERTIPLVTGIPSYLNLKAPAPPTLESAGAAGTDRAIVPPDSLGVRLGSEKLFFQTDKKTGTETWHWYDLANDPGEKNNLATGTAVLPKNLKDAIEALRAEAKPY